MTGHKEPILYDYYSCLPLDPAGAYLAAQVEKRFNEHFPVPCCDCSEIAASERPAPVVLSPPSSAGTGTDQNSMRVPPQDTHAATGGSLLASSRAAARRPREPSP